MNTDWDTRRAIEERGTVTFTELGDLIQDADEGEITQCLFEGLKEALLKNLGLQVIDVSTDEGYQLNIVKVEDDGEDPSVLVP